MTQTNQYKYDYGVLIGRFQIFHNGHKAMLDYALTQAEKVIVIIGSANQPRTFKNPFTAHERMLMIDAVYKDLERVRPQALLFSEVNDYSDDDAWVMNIQDIVDSLIERDGKDPDTVKIGMTGNKKDYTTYYIDLFPQWTFIEPNENAVVNMMNATDIRDIFFSEDIIKSKKLIAPLVPHNVLMYMEHFKTTNEFGYLSVQMYENKLYKKSWEKAPYEPIFVTTDAVVTQSGHVLLVKRRSNPGKGLYALPGGFLNPKEKIIDGMIRELREETKIKVPEPVLRGSVINKEVFDEPDRSLRGRTITHAFHIHLNGGPLPRVKGADDAEKAEWFPFNEVKRTMMFEDHYFILQKFLGNAIK